jgi:serine/threonine-protein kinase
MNPTRWDQIRSVFDQLVELDEGERVSRLEAIGATDPELRDAVSDLLRADAETGRSGAGVASPHGFTFSAPKIEHEDSLSPDELQHALGGAYRIERELSGAGMSHVFVAEERAVSRKVVVKVIWRELAQGLSAKRFQREIHAEGHRG